MKVLHVQIKGVISSETRKQVERNIIKGISKGYLITDDSMKVEVLEVDAIETEKVGYYD